MTTVGLTAGRRRAARISGVDTVWWEFGPEDAGGTVLIAHGFRGDHHGLQRVIDRLPEHRIISPDMPGYGESGEFPGRHDVRSYADWFIELAAATATQRRPFTAIGHSFGTTVVANAIDRGLRPDRVILINPVAVDPKSGDRRFGVALSTLLYRVAARLPGRGGQWLLTNRVLVDGMSLLTTKTSDRQLRRWIRDEHRRYFNGFGSLRSVLESYDASIGDNVVDHVGAFTMPTLVIGAELDEIASVREVDRLTRAAPDARLLMLPGVGHLIHYERSQESADAIRAFLADT